MKTPASARRTAPHQTVAFSAAASLMRDYALEGNMNKVAEQAAKLARMAADNEAHWLRIAAEIKTG